MPLPTVPLPTSKAKLPGGQEVEVRGLSRGEFVSLLEMNEYQEQEIATIAYGTDTPLEEAKDWYQSTPHGVVSVLVEAITALSGMGDDPGKE